MGSEALDAKELADRRNERDAEHTEPAFDRRKDVAGGDGGHSGPEPTA